MGNIGLLFVGTMQVVLPTVTISALFLLQDVWSVRASDGFIALGLLVAGTVLALSLARSPIAAVQGEEQHAVVSHHRADRGSGFRADITADRRADFSVTREWFTVVSCWRP